MALSGDNHKVFMDTGHMPFFHGSYYFCPTLLCHNHYRDRINVKYDFDIKPWDKWLTMVFHKTFSTTTI